MLQDIKAPAERIPNMKPPHAPELINRLLLNRYFRFAETAQYSLDIIHLNGQIEHGSPDPLGTKTDLSSHLRIRTIRLKPGVIRQMS